MLTEQFKTIDDRYDFCVIDCPPSLGILTLNALIASNDVIVPVQVHYYAMEGLKQLFETCEVIQEHFHPCKVKISGLLLTFVEDRLIFTRQIQQQMREFFGDLVFDTVIHRNIRLAEAPSAGQSVITYAPDCKGAQEYIALVDEILFGKEYIRAAKGQTSDSQLGVQVEADVPPKGADPTSGAGEVSPTREAGEADTTAQPSGDIAAQQVDVSTEDARQTIDNEQQTEVIDQPAVVVNDTDGDMPTEDSNNA
jgi:hypothetical protein